MKNKQFMLKYLLEKEFKQFFRNGFLVKFITLFPLAIMLIFPLVANFEIKNINLDVVDNDKSSYSRELIDKVKSSGYFKITDISSTYDEAIKNIEQDDADIILEIPPLFEKSLINESRSTVLISANAVNGSKGALGSSYLAGIVQDYNRNIQTKLMPNVGNLSSSGIDTSPRFRFNPYLSYKVFMIPALMVMLLAIICGFLPALNIVSEKENGTIEQMNVTPVGKFSLILSKVIPYWVFAFIALTICILIALFVYSLASKGNLVIIGLFVSVFVLAFSGLGLLVSNYAKSIQQAMFMMFFFVLTFIFMSGLYTPVENMPGWAQILSFLSPLRYIIQVFRMIYLKGSGFFDLLPQFFALCAFAVFFNTWAILSYRKIE